MSDDDLATLVAISARLSEDQNCRAKLRQLSDECGFQNATYGFVNTFRVHLPTCSTFSDAWWRHYFEKGFMNVDPLITVFSNARRPVETTALRGSRAFRKIWIEEASRFDLEPPSLGIPFFGPFGETSVVLLFGDLPKFDFERGRTVRKVKQMASDFHEEIMQELGCEDFLGRPKLAEREKAALFLASAGASTGASGVEMGVSAKTVETYLKNARQKLGARNTVQAVARAVAMGLIPPS